MGTLSTSVLQRGNNKRLFIYNQLCTRCYVTSKSSTSLKRKIYKSLYHYRWYFIWEHIFKWAGKSKGNYILLL